jgi:SAM-dependent methyltransferase
VSAIGEETVAARPRPGLVVAAFVATVALSSALLFAVQPMVGKALLPAFGGGAAVWTAVMLFFQIGLLAGSLLFHLTTTRLGARPAAAIHVALAVIGAALLPVLPSARSTGLGPALDVLATLAAGYGAAVLTMGANAAALQAWYARAAGAPPWWLYAVSNIGSLAGLAAYPLLFEPTLALSAQGRLWLGGFVVCAAGLAACAWLGRQAGAAPVAHRPVAIPLGRRLAWIGLAALPSSLLLGATEHITVSIAPLPLLWVLPLAAYLLSWIVAFWRPERSERWGMLLVLVLLPLLLIEAMTPVFSHTRPVIGVGLHVLALLGAGLLAHGRLALRRPEPAGLTSFYLHLSLGGALGGTVNALLAPALLDRPLEYPFALALLCLLPAAGRGRGPWFVWGAMAALMAAAPFLLGLRGDKLEYARDFYGTVRVEQDAERRSMAHGTTLHGFQWRDPARRTEPTGYYHREGGAGRLIATLEALRGPDRPIRAVIVGLGAGAMACYASPRLTLDFIEISPAVLRQARRWFSFLADCGDPAVELGDGRIRLLARPHASLDLIVVDAYSGASVPVHLATVEATRDFLDRLAPGGVLVMHVSNDHFDLGPVMAAAALEAGAAALELTASPEGSASVWIAITRDAAMAGRLAAEGWTAPLTAARPWRDDRWDLLSAIRR